MNANNMLIKYVKDKKGLIATMVAVNTGEDGVFFGFSKYHRNSENKPFKKEYGRKIAIARAKSKKVSQTIPFIAVNEFPSFKERCVKYFKESKINGELAWNGFQRIITLDI